MAGGIKVIGPAWFGPTVITVKTDPYSNIPIGKVPFDRYFYFRLYYNSPNEIPDDVYLFTQNSNHSERELGFVYLAKDKDASDSNLKSFYGIDILVIPLQPDLDYYFTFLKRDALRYKPVFQTYFQKGRTAGQVEFNNVIAQKRAVGDQFRPDLANIEKYYLETIEPIYVKFKVDKFKGDFEKADEAINAVLKAKDFVVVGNEQKKLFDSGNDSEVFLAGVDFNIQNNAARRVTADAGIIAAGFTKGFTTATHYVGVSYSFRSFDTDIPFRFVRRQIGQDQLKLLSLHLGLTLRSLQKQPYRDNLLGSNNLMLGMGYRLSHVINLVGGGLFYNKTQQNPLLTGSRVGVRPYVGFSVNLKIRDAIGEIAKRFSL